MNKQLVKTTIKNKRVKDRNRDLLLYADINYP